MATSTSAHPNAPDRAATQKLAFIGVTTGGSSIMSLFPIWAELLELNATIVGYDLPLGAPAGRYRECIDSLAADESVAGALVTSHKAAMFDHARDLFGSLDPSAELCREVSCIARREEGLVGWAKDPITAALAIDHLLDGRPVADAVCFGAGGAGLAIVVCLMARNPKPSRIVLVDVDEQRLALARQVHAELGSGVELTCHLHSDPAENDRLVSASPAGSLIVNATGMGKDRPGAPITPAARFPEQALAWDLNYRGELDFLRIAEAQAGERRLHVADGWRYFLHGWSEVIAEVFGVELTPERFDALAAVADRFNTAKAEGAMSRREMVANDATVKAIAGEFRERFDMLEESGQLTALARWLTENALARIADELELKLTEATAAQFVTHLALALDRLQRGEPVTPSAVVADEVAEYPHEQAVMRGIMDECKQVLDREVPQAEVDYMTVHLCALMEDG